MVKFIDNTSIRQLLNVDDLEITETSTPIQLFKQFSVKNNDIRIAIVFPVYSANEAYDPKLDNHIYELSVVGPIARLGQFNKVRCDAKTLELKLRSISTFIKEANYTPVFTTNTRNKNLFKNYDVTTIRFDRDSKCERAIIWGIDKEGVHPIIVTSPVRQQVLRQDGTFIIETHNSVYTFALMG